MNKISTFILTAAAITLASCAREQVQNANAQAPAANVPVKTAPTGKKPNIILIVSDDQGYADLGFQGSKEIATPNLDLLAASGVICTAGYVTFPVCSPSRAGFVSGRHGARMGYDTNADGDTRTNPAIGLPLSERTIGDALQDAGYKTGIIGKWHLGSNPYFHPNKRGFDEFFGFLRGGHNYWQWTPTPIDQREEAANSKWGDYSAPILRNEEIVPGTEKRYLTDVFSDEAVSYVERHQADPFFLYLAYNAPHNPVQASPEYLARVSDKLTGKRKTYAAMLLALDDGVGRLRAKLKELKLDNNTLICFVSDNGGPTGDNASSNLPLRGVKGDVWEGGIRVPFVVSWPSHLPAGKRYGKPVTTLDFVPTALGAAGVNTLGLPGIEGSNLLPFLSGKNRGTPNEKLFWRHFNGSWALREGDWKMVQENNGKRHLFNITKDIGEKNDVMKTNAKIANRLLGDWREWNSHNAAFIPWWRDKGIVATARDD